MWRIGNGNYTPPPVPAAAMGTLVKTALKSRINLLSVLEAPVNLCEGKTGATISPRWSSQPGAGRGHPVSPILKFNTSSPRSGRLHLIIGLPDADAPHANGQSAGHGDDCFLAVPRVPKNPDKRLFG